MARNIAPEHHKISLSYGNIHFTKTYQGGTKFGTPSAGDNLPQSPTPTITPVHGITPQVPTKQLLQTLIEDEVGDSEKAEPNSLILFSAQSPAVTKSKATETVEICKHVEACPTSSRM